MIAELTHDQAAEEIEAVALGIAPEEVSSKVTAHATRCPECAAELRSFYRVVAALSTLIPERQLNRGHSAGIKSRLVAKTGAGQEAGAGRRLSRAEPVPSTEARAPASRAPRAEAALPEGQDRSSMPIWIAVVATLIAMASIAAWLNARGGSDVLPASMVTETAAAGARVVELEDTVAAKDAMIASLSGPGVRIIGLFNREAREPLARMFWDRRSDRWSLFVYSLRQPRPGRTFRVWLGTDDGRVSLGTFQPASDGTAMFSAEHSIAIAALNTVSISEEDVGADPRRPTGPVVLAGALR